MDLHDGKSNRRALEEDYSGATALQEDLITGSWVLKGRDAVVSTALYTRVCVGDVRDSLWTEIDQTLSGADRLTLKALTSRRLRMLLSGLAL